MLDPENPLIAPCDVPEGADDLLADEEPLKDTSPLLLMTLGTELGIEPTAPLLTELTALPMELTPLPTATEPWLTEFMDGFPGLTFAIPATEDTTELLLLPMLATGAAPMFATEETTFCPVACPTFIGCEEALFASALFKEPSAPHAAPECEPPSNEILALLLPPAAACWAKAL